MSISDDQFIIISWLIAIAHLIIYIKQSQTQILGTFRLFVNGKNGLSSLGL